MVFQLPAFKALTIIGVKLPKAAIVKTLREKAFEHEHPENVNFDPTTGKKCWNESHSNLLTGKPVVFTPSGIPIFGCDVWEAAGGIVFDIATESYESPHIYIGGAVASKSSNEGDWSLEQPMRLNINIPAFKGNLRGYLEPHQLWDATKFGIWPVLSLADMMKLNNQA